MQTETVVFTARKFITMDPDIPEATAVAVRDGRIVAVGSLDEVTAGLSAFAIADNLAEHVVIAGLIDQHLHPLLGATTLVTEVIATEDWHLPGRTFAAATSGREYRDRLAVAEADRAGTDEWLVSWGYHPLWHGELDRAVLDAISTTRPIVIWHRSCHEFFLNTAACDAMGLTEEAMAGLGRMSEMMDWEAGHWWESGTGAVAGPIFAGFFTQERLMQGLTQMVAYLHGNGVTAINEPGIMWDIEPWSLYQAILGAEATPFGSTFLVDARTQADKGLAADEVVADAEAQVARARQGKVRLLNKAVKFFADGAIISQRMQMREPYLHEDGQPDLDHAGEWMMDPTVFAEYARAYWDAGWQIHTHVNGDAGLDMVLDTLEACERATPREHHRSVIVHFANSTDDQVARIAALGAIVSANPYYPVGFADRYAEHGLGPERADSMVRARSVLDHGVRLSYHSDLPMGPAEPLAFVDFGVNRRTPSGRVAGPEQRITVDEALRAVTIEAAYSWRMEDQLGSITPGKMANFTVLDADPYEVDPAQVRSIGVRGVVFEGTWRPVPTACG